MALNYPVQLARMSRAVNGGSPFDTYTTAKSVINQEDVVALGPGFWVTKRGLKIRGRAGVKNTTGNPTMQIIMKLGTIAAPVTVFDSGVIQLNASAHTLLPFSWELELRVDKDNIGANAAGNATTTKLAGWITCRGIMITKTSGQVDSVQGEQVIQYPVAAPALTSGFDAGIVNQLDFWVGFSSSNSLNGWQTWDYQVWDEGVANPSLQ